MCRIASISKVCNVTVMLEETSLHLPLPRESIPSTMSMSVCVFIKLIILWHASSRQGKEYLNVIRSMICLIFQAHMPSHACLQTLSRVLCDKVLDMCYCSHFDVGRKNKQLFLAQPSLHARYTVQMTLETVNTDGNDGLTKARH